MKKKIAIITGASRGIGETTALTLAQDGYAVCINYLHNQQPAEKIAERIKTDGGEAIALQADMGSESAVMQLFTAVDRLLGPVTALVNNAGINGGISKVEAIRADCLETVFKTNVFGVFYTCREAILRMKENGGGAIVNVSSEAAKFGGNQLAHYAASKAAVNTLTIGLAREVAADNIRVNTVSPGVIETEIHQFSPPERIATLKKSLPFGRMGTPTEVAKTILWLLSDHASYLSGSIIPITGAR